MEGGEHAVECVGFALATGSRLPVEGNFAKGLAFIPAFFEKFRDGSHDEFVSPNLR